MTNPFPLTLSSHKYPWLCCNSRSRPSAGSADRQYCGWALKKTASHTTAATTPVAKSNRTNPHNAHPAESVPRIPEVANRRPSEEIVDSG